jgi:hypothetical protein
VLMVRAPTQASVSGVVPDELTADRHCLARRSEATPLGRYDSRQGDFAEKL